MCDTQNVISLYVYVKKQHTFSNVARAKSFRFGIVNIIRKMLKGIKCIKYQKLKEDTRNQISKGTLLTTIMALRITTARIHIRHTCQLTTARRPSHRYPELDHEHRSVSDISGARRIYTEGNTRAGERSRLTL